MWKTLAFSEVCQKLGLGFNVADRGREEEKFRG